MTGRAQALDEAGEIAHQQAGMRLAGGAEVAVHAQVDPQVAGLEPRAAACGERGRLGDLGDAEQAVVEGACLRLAAGRHRELHVIHADDRGRVACRVLARAARAHRRSTMRRAASAGVRTGMISKRTTSTTM